MKILLLGANGQVGFELQRSLAPLGEVVAATRSGNLPGGAACERVDLYDADALAGLCARVAPQLIVNAAAHTAVDRAEDEEELALRANGTAPGVLGRWAAQHEAAVVHYSTDYVFDGQGTRPYREDDATAPIGAYGRTKCAGEEALAASGAAYLNFRTAWVYAARGGNFLRTMLRLARERDRLGVVADQRGAPTPARLIASTTVCVLARWLQRDAKARQDTAGSYHLVSAGECSWHDFAVAIFEQALAAGLITKFPKSRRSRPPTTRPGRAGRRIPCSTRASCARPSVWTCRTGGTACATSSANWLLEGYRARARQRQSIWRASTSRPTDQDPCPC